jgi:hypothetical protein
VPELFGRQLSKQHVLERVGDLKQIAGVRTAELLDGPGRGVRIADITTGSGLDYTVLLDRGMDIAAATWLGMPLAWLSPAGVVPFTSHDDRGLGWLRGFHGGLMASCGMSNVGSPSTDGGEEYGLHGRLSFIAATTTAIDESWDGEVGTVRVSGTLREARVFGENLELRRTISSTIGEPVIRICDIVTNLGYQSTPFMMLYHINLGWPLLDENAELIAAECDDTPRDAEAQRGVDRARVFEPPTPGYAEQVFYRDLPADSSGMANVALVNGDRGVLIRYGKSELPNLIQWKMMGQGHYVCGLEPANCLVGGRAAERDRGTLRHLEPGESRQLDVDIEMLSSQSQIDDIRSALTSGAKGGQ